jgi:hypothetical protein
MTLLLTTFIQQTVDVGPSSAVIPTQLSAAMACGYVLWMLQKAKSIPWISQVTVKLNAAIRLFVATVSTIGISIVWQSSAHQLVIGNLTWVVIGHGLWHVFTQYAATHGFEKILNVIPSTAIVGPGGGSAAEVVPTTKPAPLKEVDPLKVGS